MSLFKNESHNKLAKEFAQLEDKNRLKKQKHIEDFNNLRKETQVHQKRTENRLNKCIPSFFSSSF